MFAPCPSCRRHVRVEESACPFCSASLHALNAAPDTDKRMTRARLFAFAATVSVAAATFACPKETDGGGGGGGGIVQPYGAPPRPPEPDTGLNEQPEASAIAPPATIEPPATVPTLPNTAPTPKPTYAPGPPVAMYGGPPMPMPSVVPAPTSTSKPGPGGPAAAYGAPPSPGAPLK